MKQPKYVEQCAAAHQLIELKMKLGFNEGDYVWDGKKVRLIGHDFIDVTKKFRPDYPIFNFAMIEKQELLTVDGINFPLEISMMYGSYIAETIYRPVWIPTQEQLQNMLPNYSYTILLTKFLNYTEMHNSYNKYTDSKEQMWLKYFMYATFQMLWDYTNNKWEVHIAGDKYE